MLNDPVASRHELGEFIRSHRERLQPDAYGMPTVRRRRTPGLRREELGQLAGVSGTWLSWIEQGRDVSVSPAALSRLARVMRLTTAERDYLFDLAGKRDPEAPMDSPLGNLPLGLTEIVAGMPGPAYLLDRTWNAITWNGAAAELFSGWLDGADHNLLRFVFLSPAAPRLIDSWEMRARRLTAEFRADVSRYLATPDIRKLTEELGQSPLFAEAWEAHAVVEREGGERTFNHPARGFLRFEQVTLLLARHPDVKLVALTPRPAG